VFALRLTNPAKLLTKDEARRIAANIAKLPNVRFGSKADIGLAPVDVRFNPKSGRYQARSKCPLCANSDIAPSTPIWSQLNFVAEPREVMSPPTALLLISLILYLLPNATLAAGAYS
jgi:hypothetical protein